MYPPSDFFRQFRLFRRHLGALADFLVLFGVFGKVIMIGIAVVNASVDRLALELPAAKNVTI